MSTNRLRLHVDQENQHKVAPAKDELRNSAGRDATGQIQMGAKRPLSSKGNANEKRLRVPLGGKDQNKVFSGLQRSKSLLPLTFHSPALKHDPLPQTGSVHHLAKPPTLTKSNLSLGFFTRPTKLTPPAPNPRTAHPHKNTLFPLEELHRPHELVPRFSSDTLTKAPSQELPKLSTLLQNTFSDATHRLHASNIPQEGPFSHNVDPMKKGTRGMEMERLIEELAEDENSIEIVPQRPEWLEDMKADVPLGCSPLSREQAPFLYEEKPAPVGLAASFGPDTAFFSEDEDEELCSETEAAHNTAFHEELNAGDGLGLSAGELHELLDF